MTDESAGAFTDAAPPERLVQKDSPATEPLSTDSGGVAAREYVPGLDGVRALAITAVLFFHGGFGWASGGFLGVDVFFVLSGYLITGLLLAEYDRSGTICLRRFWARRARRLLPALMLMLLAVCLYAVFLAPSDTLAQVRGDALSTLFYFANWRQAYSPQGYLAALQTPSPLVHTWSLAIEEQFYLAWPLLVLAVMRVTGSRRVLGTMCALGAAASAVAMAVIFDGGLGTNRAYYGTDSRAQDLLIGAVLAVLVASWKHRTSPVGRGSPRTGSSNRLGMSSARYVARRISPVLLVIVGGAGGAFVCWAIASTSADTTWLYDGGFAAVSVATAMFIWCVVTLPRSPWAVVCSISPVRYLGRISYGLYLWHWPIFLVLDHSRTGLLGWPLFALRAAVSLSAAALSYHLVEMPIRRGALAPKIGRVLTPAAIGTTALAILLATATGTPSLAATAGPNAQSLQATAQYYGSPTSKSATDVPAGAVPGVAPATPHVAAGSGGPIRLLLLGDSEAAFLAFGLAPGIGRYGVEYQGDGVFGCGMLYDGPTLFRAIVSNADLGIRIPKVLVTCSNQLTRWRNDIANYHPDVIALEEGSIDVRDHYVDGHWTYLGQPGFDNLELGAIDTAVRLFLQSGANVMLLTAPYYQQPEQPDGQPWPEDSPARVNVFNHLLAEVAARYPGRVELVALGARLDPGGRYTAVIDGQQMRFSDGIHPTVAAGKYVQVWLAPKIAALGRLARERERLTAPAASG